MNATNRDNLAPHEKIKQAKEKLNLSWEDIATKLFYELLDDSHLSEQEETDEIAKFTDRFKKAVERPSKTCKLYGDIKYTLEQYWEKWCEFNEKVKQIDDEIKYNHTQKQQILDAQEDFELFNERSTERDIKFFTDFFEQHKQKSEELNQLFYIDNLNNLIFIAQQENSPTFLKTWLGNYFLYVNDDGMPKIDEAKQWYEEASKQGDKIAQYQLGLIYEYNSKYKNENLAFKFYQDSANQQFGLALAKLAWCYYKGLGTIKNEDKFFEYAKQSADLEVDLGIAFCCFAYMQSLGTEPDMKKVNDFYEKYYKNPSGNIELLMEYSIGLKFHRKISLNNVNLNDILVDILPKFNISIDDMKSDIDDFMSIIKSNIQINPNKIDELFKLEYEAVLYKYSDNVDKFMMKNIVPIF